MKTFNYPRDLQPLASDETNETEIKSARDAKISRRIGAAGLLMATGASAVSFLGYIGEAMGIETGHGPVPVVQVVEQAWQDPGRFLQAAEDAAGSEHGLMPGVMTVAIPLIAGAGAGVKALKRRNANKQETLAQARHIAHPIETTPQTQSLSFLSNEAGEIIK